MAELFYLSDLHLKEEGILKFRPQFKTMAEHDDFIIDNWNSTVSKRDVVWVFGDIGVPAMYDTLNGQKNVVLGNHDRNRTSELIHRFNQIHGASTRVNIKGARVVGTHVPIHPQEMMYGWEFNLHGHTHNGPILLPNGEPDLRYVSLCCEHTGYTPMSRAELVEQLICRKQLVLEDPKTYPPRV